MTDLTLVDGWRLVLMVVSLWLAGVAVRLAILRSRDNRNLPRGQRRYNPMFYLSMAYFLLAVVILRPKHFGEGVNAELLVLTPGVILAAIALVPRIEFLSRRRNR